MLSFPERRHFIKPSLLHVQIHMMMPNRRLRVSPIMDDLLIYGKRLIGIKTDNLFVGKSAGGIIYFSVSRSEITFVTPNNQDESLIFFSNFSVT